MRHCIMPAMVGELCDRDTLHRRLQALLAAAPHTCSARRCAAPLSDIDIAVFLDGEGDRFDQRLRLMDSLSIALGTDRLEPGSGR